MMIPPVILTVRGLFLVPSQILTGWEVVLLIFEIRDRRLTAQKS